MGTISPAASVSRATVGWNAGILGLLQTSVEISGLEPENAVRVARGFDVLQYVEKAGDRHCLYCW